MVGMNDARLAPGDLAPDFTLDDQDGTPVTLSSLRGGKVVLYFYPEAMTPGCTTEACDFRDSLNSFKAAGIRVLGVSKDEVEKLKRFAERDRLNFTLLADPDLAVQQAYGVWGEKSLYGKIVVGSIRSTFVIDEEGRIAKAFYNVKATGHVARIRRELGLDG
ncbi:alkyl hydroperoxide reductase/ Thiol specific antioxidant/ Mal allergen [Agromyces mediolanus]|uniref:thioredoxin-dependent peroxiredoxin n=2 Tax=Agromyces mediolanus TaxID=41986 RepID=A0A918KUR6_AGRME|nr:alkyl hydroperoxide reductase/ Thiol specific antioxidant/ Mal allergen [Agromyces mediolanus]GLJ74169.1 alkyl hydroperoxide reductase/ Thiol specific antioxidant/ Mal allergen [Agromyces mediolanus]